MNPWKRIFIVVLVGATGALSAIALAACSDEDVVADDADEQVSVVLREYDIAPGRIEVVAGEIEFEVTNDGDRVHELAIRTPTGVESTGDIKPGEAASMTVDLADGTYRIYDPRGDNRARGMRATVVVSSGDATVTERTVERTVVEEEPDVIDEPEVQEPEVQEPPAPQAPPPPVTVTQVVPTPTPTTTTP